MITVFDQVFMGPRIPRLMPLQRGMTVGWGALRRDEFQGDAVVAVAQAGGLGAVVEQVALVAEAAGAVVFRALLEDLEVALHAQRAWNGHVIAGPAGVGVEFPVGLEQRQTATQAGEGPLAVLVQQRAAEGLLSVLMAQHAVGRRRQALLPVGVGELAERRAGEGLLGIGGGEGARGYAEQAKNSAAQKGGAACRGDQGRFHGWLLGSWRRARLSIGRPAVAPYYVHPGWIGSPGVTQSPASSGRPSMRFIFCTAAPAAPLPRLSSNATSRARPCASA